MSGFGRKRSYSRARIHAKLGGGVQSYLPTVNGVVMEGCFRRDRNPDAPAVVLPGKEPIIKRSAELFASSGQVVPVFIKEHVGYRASHNSRLHVPVGAACLFQRLGRK